MYVLYCRITSGEIIAFKFPSFLEGMRSGTPSPPPFPIYVAGVKDKVERRGSQLLTHDMT